MKQIKSFVAEAPKLRGAGKIKYGLWLDGCGNLYVQLNENTESGTRSHLLFSVSQYASVRNTTKSITQPNGYDLTDKVWKTSNNRNDGAFLKAVLLHLLL